MANKQISDLQARTFDGDSIIAHDVENTDPSTMSQNPYLTGSATGHAVADFIGNGEEYTTDLDTVDKHINGAINELHAINGYNYDAYDDTATYAVGDLCIYNNALYKCTTAITTAEAWNASHWTATSIADEIDELKSGFAIDSANSPNAVSVNGTYQIPANVLAHTFIIIACRRGGYGNSIMFKKDELLTFDNGFTFLGTGGGYYTLKCSNTGLLTVTNISNLTEPYILVTGFM